MSKKRTPERSLETDLDTLNQIRLEKDLTYEDLGERIGIDASALYRLLNDRRRKPNDRTVYKIRQYLDRAEIDKRATA